MTTPSAAGIWLRRYHASPSAAAELVCFPHAGGAAAYWYPLSALLAPGIETLAVQYPGRQDRHREPPVTDLHTLADRLAEVLAGPPARPRVFLGHSMGASLAYEVAARLEGRPGAPARLILSGRRAPSRWRPSPEPSGDAALVARVRALGGTDAHRLTDPDVLELVLPALRADHLALAGYRDTPGAAVSCPVTAFAGERDAEAPVDDVAAWRHHTTGGFDLRVFPGGHFFIADDAPGTARLIADLVRAVPTR
ncbi:alpha/beta fold hydrolase [Herbidospora sp. NBRC 101105]|uniref:thioesterase II family protein n=1 Tax=Herbidospora sp. NBRC 101105 TaxID=3032195 RepID=UPI0024A0666B|nr:alpha/beta fold hydrolase [Herbidospora sp. NBRC 101105]GLX94059.1 thioesterase [Herbidospora sp. NBRC 101105]